MRDEKHYRKLLADNPSAGVGFTLAANAVYAARYGVCENEQRSTDEWAEIARRLKKQYGESLSVDETASEMDIASRSAAAAKLGSMTSKRKARSSVENGRLGGRPKK